MMIMIGRGLWDRTECKDNLTVMHSCPMLSSNVLTSKFTLLLCMNFINNLASIILLFNKTFTIN